jgi:ribose/xylose/arabinose/galactoside ABC-type transport system permease subunit
MGDAYLLIPIAAVVLGGTSLSGGTGGYLGSLVGSIIVVILDALLVSIQVSQGLRQALFGLIILIMMLLFRNRPANLSFRRRLKVKLFRLQKSTRRKSDEDDRFIHYEVP